ncbi:S-adenosyl-L-methionine-dependent methyltransferase [Fomitiporia mediterranea MF3/22]|uniref:S-adenosyl-L-methionine-dependent methyltransferase n=1 Tax=Fomitiporia mediterranea (strain MF3/22) TaxID=694068 RepID=UPI00044081CD|nr:S-adenosyl-L-methionine-dependent methyltransferase [Fomitiporia mediterranea MF3/22]EJD04514.1 S-adenosyl-L-methionine-dependent methyltransferase [Fomitiporia mediterranea MF3/22]
MVSNFVGNHSIWNNKPTLFSKGEGLAIAPSPRPPWVVIVPFALPGEKIRARIYRNARLHSFADFLGVVQPNTSMRDMNRVRCRYFEKCGGCQYQMLSYETQLDLKRDVVARAYETFSGLPSSSVPVILPTAPSPLQYGYRTKITPHFDAPVKRARSKKQKAEAEAAPEPFPEGKTVPIGFNKVGTREVLDIEECPIATPVINSALGPLRTGILEKLHTYKKGVSLLLRDSLPIPPESSEKPSEPEEHICITDHRGKVREKVGDMLFEYNASSFFQNNNSVLVSLVEYVRAAIFPSSEKHNDNTEDTTTPARTAPTHLVDAYCGAGLFSIMLSPYFETIAGIELSSESIAAATHNAKLNKLPAGRVTFRTGDAAHIFASVPDFPPSSTAVIIDPPRKGCDENFLDQLLAFRSTTVVYVSCNVHTQARDVGILLRKSAAEVEKGEKTGKYVLESVRGFDLFPQTAHVESVAVLRLI